MSNPELTEETEQLCPDCQYIMEELRRLRELEKTWQKVCAFEKEKWLKWCDILPGRISKEEKEHLKNLESLAK